MTRYIALIHKEAESSYGVSFPDVPGVITAADTIDEAMRKASEVLEFAAEDWREHTGRAFPQARTIDELRQDPAFQEDAADAVVVAATVPRRGRGGGVAGHSLGVTTPHNISCELGRRGDV